MLKTKMAKEKSLQKYKNIKANKNIENAMNVLLKQKYDFKTLKDLQRLKREKERTAKLEDARLEKKRKIKQKYEWLEEYRIKAIELKTGIIQSRVKDSIEINTLTRLNEEYDLSKEKDITSRKNVKVTTSEKNKENKKPITEIKKEDKIVNTSTTISLNDQYKNMKRSNIKVFLVKEYGKWISKKASRAEETSISIHLNKYKNKDKEEIVLFRKMV